MTDAVDITPDDDELGFYLDNYCEEYRRAFKQRVEVAGWERVRHEANARCYNGSQVYYELVAEPVEMQVDATEMGHVPLAVEFGVTLDGHHVDCVGWLHRATTERLRTIATYVLEPR